MKEQAGDFTKIFLKNIANKGLVYRIYKEITKLPPNFKNGKQFAQTLHHKSYKAGK